MRELHFLEMIADNLEQTTGSTDTIRIPEQFFIDNFVPYIIGERSHPNIMLKLMELTNHGLSSISLMDSDGNLVKELPAIFPRSLDTKENFESDLYKAENKLIPAHANEAIGAVLTHHLSIPSQHSWDDYLSKFNNKNYVGEESIDDDDDDFEIIY